jgi:16S rRNA (guanine966-N2)-methyltransferase
VDDDRRAIDCARRNAAALQVEAQVRVLHLDLLAASSKTAGALEKSGFGPFDLVFADPPYARAQAAADRLAELAARGLFGPRALLVIEHAARAEPARPAAFAALAAYRYGDTAVALWETIAEPGQS